MDANYKLIYHGSKTNLPATREANSFYLTDDTLELYFGEKKYSKAVRLYTNAEGKPTAPAEDVLYINTDSGVGEVYNGSVWTVVIKGYATTLGSDHTTVPTSKAVKDYVDSLTAISDDEDNALERKTGEHAGLYVPTPEAASEYSLKKLDAASAGAAASYQLTKDSVGIGAVIDIPKDMVVESGTVVEVSAAQAGTEGFPATAGTYIKLTIANKTSDTLWIDVGGLIEYVTSGSAAGDMVVVAVSADHKVTATITDGTITLAKLHTDVQTAIGKAHEHANKALLDTYTQTEENLADAVAKKHEHANAEVLNGITAAKVSGWDDAAAKKHEHANKAELDLIETGDKAKWDAAEGKAHEHTNKAELDKFATGDKDNLDALVAALTVGTF